MLNFLVRSALGSWGGRVLDFYLANSLWINGIILFLVLLNFLGRRAYLETLTGLLAHLAEKGLDIKKVKTVSAMQTLLKKGEIPWIALAKANWFPLLAVPGKFLPVVKTPGNLQELFSAENLLKMAASPEQRKP
jgi:hypothetical protein